MVRSFADEGDVAARHGESTDDFEADPLGTSSNGGDFAAEGELVQNGGVDVLGLKERHCREILILTRGSRDAIS